MVARSHPVVIHRNNLFLIKNQEMMEFFHDFIRNIIATITPASEVHRQSFQTREHIEREKVFQ